MFRDFLINNYLWFVIISLILIFALIGYLTDIKKKEKIGDETDKEPIENKKVKKVKKTDEEQFLEDNEELLKNISLNEAVKEKKKNNEETPGAEDIEETILKIEDNVVTYDDDAIAEPEDNQ